MQLKHILLLSLNFAVLLLNCVYYSKHELDYAESQTTKSGYNYSMEKSKEAITRARAEKFLAEGDSSEYFNELNRLKFEQNNVSKSLMFHENAKSERDYIDKHCCTDE